MIPGDRVVLTSTAFAKQHGEVVSTFGATCVVRLDAAPEADPGVPGETIACGEENLALEEE